jgi:hypothetical protein
VVKDLQGPLDEVQMAVGDRVKGAGIYRDVRHGRPRGEDGFLFSVFCYEKFKVQSSKFKVNHLT